MYKFAALVLILLAMQTALHAGGNRLDADTIKPVTMIMDGKSKTLDSNVLIVVDGKIAGTIREIKNIQPIFDENSFKSVTVLKDSAALAKYGERGKAGVLEISLQYDKRTGGNTNAEPGDYDILFEKVEVEAEFPGGSAIWRKYLERNLNGSVPDDNGAPVGKYTVIVQFVVNKEGNVSDIRALTNHGYGMEQEVIKAIVKGPKWAPAMQSGRQVKAYRKQAVTFWVSAEGFEIVTKKEFELQAGTDNEVGITVEKATDENLEVTISRGSIVRRSEGNYIAKVDSPGKAIITIRNKKKNKEVGKVLFEVRN